MSSRTQSSTRSRNGIKSPSPSGEQKITLLNQRISQISSNMRSSMMSSAYYLDEKPCAKDTNLEEFLNNNRLENLLQVLKENQVKFQDLANLSRDDMIDMKIPIGPRNRLIQAIEKLNFSQVSYFKNEAEKKPEPSHIRKRSRDINESHLEDEGRTMESILAVLKEICERQKIMMKAIEENKREIASIKQGCKKYN